MCLVSWSISFILGFGRAFVRRWLCPVFGLQLVSRFLAGYTLLLLYWLPLFGACSRRCGSCRRPEFPCFFVGVPLFASRTWVPAGFLVCCRVYSALLLCWLPLFGAYSRRCGSCRPPEFRFGLRLPWCVCFFLDLGCLVCTFGSVCLLGSCWFSHHGLEVLTLFWVWRANLASSALLAASVPYVPGVSVCFRVLGVPFSAAPLLAAAVRRLLPALRLSPAS